MTLEFPYTGWASAVFTAMWLLPILIGALRGVRHLGWVITFTLLMLLAGPFAIVIWGVAFLLALFEKSASAVPTRPDKGAYNETYL